MNNHELLKQLKSLETGQPDIEWVSRNREILLSQIRSQQAKPVELFSRAGANFSWQAVQVLFPVRLAVRAVTAVGLVIVFLLGSSVTSAWADRSLPGDLLYNVKITTEKVQSAITTSAEDKTKLEMEFAGKRLDEIKRLSAEQPTSGRQKEIKNTLASYKKNLEQVNNNLAQLAGQGNAEKTAELATLVNSQTTGYSKSLAESEQAIKSQSNDFGQQVKEVLDLSLATTDQALEIMVEKQQLAGAALSPEAIKQIIGERINKAKEKLTALKQEANNQENALSVISAKAQRQAAATRLATAREELALSGQSLESAQAALAGNDLTSVLNKLKEASQALRDAEAALTEPVLPAVEVEGASVIKEVEPAETLK
ncbi:MAG: DUF5667 domain-containing protein [Patescibacteria group bacterium]|jgi:hypothetical protein